MTKMIEKKIDILKYFYTVSTSWPCYDIMCLTSYFHLMSIYKYMYKKYRVTSGSHFLTVICMLRHFSRSPISQVTDFTLTPPCAEGTRFCYTQIGDLLK